MNDMPPISLLDMAIGAPPGAGHNQPPGPPTAADVKAYLDDSQAGLIRRREELRRAIDAFVARYPVIESDDVQAAATENLEMLRKLGIGKSSRAEEAREAAKKPFLEAGRAVDGWFKSFADSVAAIHAKLCAPATAYAEKLEEERRKLAQAAAKLAQEAAEAAARAAEQASAPEAFDEAILAAEHAEHAVKLAEAKPAEHSRTVGTYGSTSSLRSRWLFEVTDAEAVDRSLCLPSDALIRARIAAAGADAGKLRLSGVRIYQERKLGTRS